MTVKIGHASSDEYGNAKGGKAGDQTGREVLIQDWYLRKEGWSTVFRAKEPSIAEKIAKAMEQACANNNIGYDQAQRTTLYESAEKCNWNITKIIEKCECDCSSLVAVCVNTAGIAISKNMYTGNQKAVLSATGKFKVLLDKKYLTKPDYLKRGDILLGPGHTAIVLTELESELAVEKAKSFDKNFVGAYRVTANGLNIRRGAGTNKNILTTIPNGTKVYCYGYYTRFNNTNWLYVQFTYKNATYKGFASVKYLTK